MKRLRSFDYYEPATVAEAAGILEAGGGHAHPLAGGTDLLIDLKTLKTRPAAIVNLKRIGGLSSIEVEDGGTRIGALVSIRELELSQPIAARHRALSQAAGLLAPLPVRTLATLGGNIARASPASDMAPPLLVHGARVTVAGAGGEREVPIEEFYLGPGVTVLAEDEIITSVFVPREGPGTGSAHLKLGKRGGGTDIALAGAAAGIELSDGGEIIDCRIALASLGPTPLRAPEGEAVLRGQPATAATLEAAAESAAAEARPIGDMRAGESYRRSLARVLTLRALREAVRAAGGEAGA